MDGGPQLLALDGPLDLHRTLFPLRRGSHDPAHVVTSDGAAWRAGRTASGPATVRIVQHRPDRVEVRAWGPGADEARDAVPALLGQLDDAAGFDPGSGVLLTAFRRSRTVRLTRTGQVMDALAAAVLEQRVIGREARQSWRWLVRRHGTPAPGPAPEGMHVPPGPERWADVPVWDFHRAGVDPGRARALVAAARLAGRLEETVRMSPEQAMARLVLVPGIGPWTAAEVVQRSHGAADAVSVGDYNLPALVGWAFLGRDVDDAGMLQLLEPYRPHRQRAVRHLLAGGAANRPRRGPRLALQDHRAY